MGNELFDNLPAEKLSETAISEPITREDALLAQVLSSGNIEVLERYIALRKSEEERQARIAFEEAFSRMRAEMPHIAKKKDNKAFNSKYAPIEDIQGPCDPIIYKHGFSYSWREEAIPEGKRVWIDIFGYGHTKSNYFDCPKINGNNAQNALHTAQIMTAYGKRSTLVSGFGIVVEGEDSDGQITDDVEQLRLDLTALCEERDATGKLKLPQNAFDIINAELKKPVEDMDVARMKAFYKRAKAMVEGKK